MSTAQSSPSTESALPGPAAAGAEAPGTPKPRGGGAAVEFSLRRLLRPHLRALTVGLVAVVGAGVANLLEPWPLKWVLDNVLKHQALKGVLATLLHAGGHNYDRHRVLVFACVAVLAIAVMDAICTYVQKLVTTTVGQWVTHDLRRSLYAHIQRLSLAYHDQKRTGDLISRVTDDIDTVQSFVTGDLLVACVNVITLFGMVGVMFWVNWQFTLVALSIAPVLAAIVFTYTRRIKRASRAMRKSQGQIVSVVQEVLTSIRTVKAFARESYEIRRLEQESLASVEIAMRARSLKAKLQPAVQVVVAVGTCLVLWFGARLALAGVIDSGTLVVFVMYLSKMYKPMQQLSQMSDDYGRAAVGYERIQEVFDTRSDVADLPGARPAPRFKGRIDFQHVSFCYSPEQPILEDVSLHIEAGELAALVGPTGAGKTTIVSLIARFYDPTSGTVKIDGTDVRRYRQATVRQQMAFVLQETLLFHGSVWQNIAYGRPEASQRDIVRAAELANAMEFIDKLPAGMDTLVGERGVTLSGGQRQRIAIARAIIRDSPILILDEPSSGLDAASEKLVFEALDRLMKGRTAIVIAHRLATIRQADTIYVVKDGRIPEHGSHEQLLKHDGLYAELYHLQFDPEPLKA